MYQPRCLDGRFREVYQSPLSRNWVALAKQRRLSPCRVDVFGLQPRGRGEGCPRADDACRLMVWQGEGRDDEFDPSKLWVNSERTEPIRGCRGYMKCLGMVNEDWPLLLERYSLRRHDRRSSWASHVIAWHCWEGPMSPMCTCSSARPVLKHHYTSSRSPSNVSSTV